MVALALTTGMASVADSLDLADTNIASGITNYSGGTSGSPANPASGNNANSNGHGAGNTASNNGSGSDGDHGYGTGNRNNGNGNG